MSFIIKNNELDIYVSISAASITIIIDMIINITCFMIFIFILSSLTSAIDLYKLIPLIETTYIPYQIYYIM